MNDIDKVVDEMRKRTKGKYITQGVSFNKDSPRQIELLKFALENSDSFSGLVKETLAKMLDNGGIHHSLKAGMSEILYNFQTQGL